MQPNSGLVIGLNNMLCVQPVVTIAMHDRHSHGVISIAQAMTNSKGTSKFARV